MSDFVELHVLLLPGVAGGRTSAVSPREGSYRPFARSRESGERFRLRFIEGPPRLVPGDGARIVAEIEAGGLDLLPGDEADLLELSDQLVGVMTVLRLWRHELAV